MENVHDLRMHKIEFFGDYFITIGREGSMKVFSARVSFFTGLVFLPNLC